MAVPSYLASTGRFLLLLYRQWDCLNVPKMSASLTYYTIVALAPLTVIFMAAAGFIFGSAAAQDHLVEAVRLQIGDTGASVIQTLITRIASPRIGLIASVLGAIALFFGATSVFIDLKGSLKTIWNVPEAGTGSLWDVLRERLVSFAMVLITGVVLVLSISVSITLSAIHHYAGDLIPAPAGHLAEAVLSFVVTTLVFAMIYRIVPPERMPWRHIAFGAAVTAVLFALGKAVIAAFLSSVGAASPYGAAGSLFAFLLWLYYSSQVFFIGAVITRSRTRAERIGQAIRHEQDPPSATPNYKPMQPAGPLSPRSS